MKLNYFKVTMWVFLAIIIYSIITMIVSSGYSCGFDDLYDNNCL